MRFCFALFNYFPFGGLERDFMDISKACLAMGHTVDVYTGDWQGDIPDGMRVLVLPVAGWTNHGKARSFHLLLKKQLKEEQYDLVVGFNKMPGLDVYYGADVCYLARIKRQRGLLSTLTPRYCLFAAFEKAVFAPISSTRIIHLAEAEKKNYQTSYATPDSRFFYGPPGVDVPRIRRHLTSEIRLAMRCELGLQEGQIALLMIGSNFQTKGVDRSILALATLPGELRDRCQLFVVGKGKPSSFEKMTQKNGVAGQVHFMGGRDDVPRFLAACDFLLQPSVNENTGNAIVEAIVAGLPVLATETCGYSEHVLAGDCGLVVSGDFRQEEMNELLFELLTSAQKQEWQAHCLQYAKTHELGQRSKVVSQTLTGLAKQKQAGDW